MESKTLPIKLYFEWEKRLFLKYLRVIVLRGGEETTIWQYLVEMYHFKYMEALMFGVLSLGTLITTLIGIYFSVGQVLITLFFGLTLILGLTTIQYIIDTRSSRLKVMKFWDENYKKKEGNA